jgi:Na+:H+ antiporter, NhaA family
VPRGNRVICTGFADLQGGLARAARDFPQGGEYPAGLGGAATGAASHALGPPFAVRRASVRNELVQRTHPVVTATPRRLADLLAGSVAATSFAPHAARWGTLGIAGIILLPLITLDVLAVQRLTPYLLLGLGLWFFVHESGVHATIAGVLLAFTIASKARINAAEYSLNARRLLDHFDRTETAISWS